MSQITRYGIIGCGMMGQEHLQNIALLDGAEVAAIFEPDAGMAAKSLALAPQATLYDSLEALVAHPDLDCYLIASPNFRHVAQLEYLAHHRPLPILVEKPLFTDPTQRAALRVIRDTCLAPIWVAMEYRYMPPISAFLDAVETATGGIKMLSLREHRFPFLGKVGDWNRFNRYTGGTFVEKCCHFFDLMRLALKSEPVRVLASGGMDVNHLGETYGGETPDILDNGFVIVDFANGARALLELCMFAEGSRYQEEVCATGPKGKIEAFVPGPSRFWPAHLGDAPIPQLIESPRDPKGPIVREIPVDPRLLAAGDHNGSTFYQHQKFLDVVRGNAATPEVSLNDGYMAVIMGIAAQISMREHRAVEISELTHAMDG